MEDTSQKARAKVKKEIISIIGEFNRNRTDFNMPQNHEYLITSYWFLGFVEGDGSFYFDPSADVLAFSLEQKGNEALLHAIKNFLHNLAVNSSQIVVNGEELNISLAREGIFRLTAKRGNFLEFVLLPLFDSLI